MSYYVLVTMPGGELLQVSTEPVIPVEGQTLKLREGNIPDLSRFTWHPGSLAFIEGNSSRLLTQEGFIKRLTPEELYNIYAAAKQNIQIEVWLDRFKMAQEINLDDPNMVSGLYGLEAAGLLAEGRAAELLS